MVSRFIRNLHSDFETGGRSNSSFLADFGAQVNLSGSVSSQYLTALLMAAPLATGDGGIEIRITDELVSQPYVDMTVRLMERFGVQVRAIRLACQEQQSATAACLTVSAAKHVASLPKTLSREKG